MDSKSLTTQEVARLCRVSDATVKRWESAGVIRSERTKGGHRRFRAEEIARFQQEQNLGARHQHGDDSTLKAGTRRKPVKKDSPSPFFDSLIAGSEEEAANILIKEFLNGVSVAELFDSVISESMQLIGDLWSEGKISVAQEHLASRVVLSSLHRLRSVVPVAPPSNQLAICFAFEGDLHELPTHFAQMTFESEGWEVWNFGPNTPLFSVAEEILHHAPRIVCISSTVMSDIERTSRDYAGFLAQIEKVKASVILGGQTFQNKKLRTRFPADLYPESFIDVARFARQIGDRK